MSRQWVIRPITVQIGTCGVRRDRTVRARAQRLTEPGRGRGEGGEHLAVDGVDPGHALRAQPLGMAGAHRAHPAPDRGHWAPGLCGDPPVSDPTGAGQQRGPDHRGRVGTPWEHHADQQHLGGSHRPGIGRDAGAGPASWTPGRGSGGFGRVPSAAAPRRMPGTPALPRPAPPRPVPGPGSRSSSRPLVTAHERGLPHAGLARGQLVLRPHPATPIHCGPPAGALAPSPCPQPTPGTRARPAGSTR